ncbi:hypothetical protein AB0L88_08085 [Saccharopolyspora shandongensis]|uniref:hypothetical protein n=1 Tax=Saccharopolyspora shandongensis TaxID=418495 RepID=UPI0034308580
MVGIRTAPTGDYLVDASGRTLYLFTKDEPGTSRCVYPGTTSSPASMQQPDGLAHIVRDDVTTSVPNRVFDESSFRPCAVPEGHAVEEAVA